MGLGNVRRERLEHKPQIVENATLSGSQIELDLHIGTYAPEVRTVRRRTTRPRRAPSAGENGFRIRKEAETALTTALGKIQTQTYMLPSKITVREYLSDEWLPARACQREWFYKGLAVAVHPRRSKLQLTMKCSAMKRAPTR